METCKVCNHGLIMDSTICPNCIRLETAFSALVDASTLISIHLHDFNDRVGIIVNRLAEIVHPALTVGLRFEIEAYLKGCKLSEGHAVNAMNRLPVIIDSLKKQ